MIPISGRLPDDLYQWLATYPLDGATTVSDKLRVAVASLKRMQGGDADYVDALSMYRDLDRVTREQMALLERDFGQHSEVLSVLMEHLPALVAALHSAKLSTVEDAKQLEAALVKRTMQLAESLLRQAVTPKAAAYDARVVTKHSGRLLELVRFLSPSPNEQEA